MPAVVCRHQVCVSRHQVCVYQICSAGYLRELVLPVTLARDHAKLLGADDKDMMV